MESLIKKTLTTNNVLINKKISIENLVKFGSVKTLNEQAKTLVTQQKTIWEVATKNFEALTRIQTKDFDFDLFKITVQFNAERIRSSAAKTDAKSIAERPCFLCLKNLPPEQKGILFQNKYLILTNPFPIFPQHLTISKLEHTPQQILIHFPDLLELSKSLPGFTVFYNGPKCGASAPDHFHFQAGNTGFLPIEKEFKTLDKNNSTILFQNNSIKIAAVENYLRRFISIESDDKNLLNNEFEKIYTLLQQNNEEEPMMNVLCNFIENKWRVIIFPREKQRPSHFFREDEGKLMVSPAAVELGGVLILPREEDFRKITKKEISQIYSEVTIQKRKFEKIINGIH